MLECRLGLEADDKRAGSDAQQCTIRSRSMDSFQHVLQDPGLELKTPGSVNHYKLAATRDILTCSFQDGLKWLIIYNQIFSTLLNRSFRVWLGNNATKLESDT